MKMIVCYAISGSAVFLCHKLLFLLQGKHYVLFNAAFLGERRRDGTKYRDPRPPAILQQFFCRVVYVWTIEPPSECCLLVSRQFHRGLLSSTPHPTRVAHREWTQEGCSEERPLKGWSLPHWL